MTRTEHANCVIVERATPGGGFLVYGKESGRPSRNGAVALRELLGFAPTIDDARAIATLYGRRSHAKAVRP